MWRRIVDHLEESRIYKRPDQMYLEFKHQDAKFSTRFLFFHPFKLRFETDYDGKGIKNVIHHPRFCPRSPFHFEIDTTRSFAVSMNFHVPNNLKYIGKYINEKISTSISLYCEEMKNFTGIIDFDYNQQFSLSFSANPNNIGMRYDGNHHGIEILYCFPEEQPSLSYRYNRSFYRTEITTQATFYGNVGTLLTTYYKKARFSSFFELNMWTLRSDTIFGFATPIFNGDSTISASYKYSTNSFIFELSLNKFDGNQKTGITAFLPIPLSIFSLKKSSNDGNQKKAAFLT